MGKWTKKELRLLKQYYETNISWARLKNYFPRHTKEAIQRKATREGLSREHLSTSNYKYMYCIVHGRMLIEEVNWVESKTKKNVRARCPIKGCNKQLRNLTVNKLSLREKYKVKSKD